MIPEKLLAQKVHVIQLDSSSNPEVPVSKESHLKTLMLFHDVLNSSQNKHLFILTDLNLFEVFILNQWTQNPSNLGKLAQSFKNVQNDFGALIHSIEFHQFSSNDTFALAQLKKIHFFTVDPFSINTESYFEPLSHYALYLLHDFFDQVPDSTSSLVLKSIRSFTRYREISADDKRNSEDVVIASFTPEATLSYCKDSIQELDSLAKIYDLKYWDELRKVLLIPVYHSEMTGEDLNSDFLTWYQHMVSAIALWKSYSSEGELWWIPSKEGTVFQEGTPFPLDRILKLKGYTSIYDTICVHLDSNLHLSIQFKTEKGDSIQKWMEFHKQWFPAFDVAYLHDSIHENESTEIFKRIPLPFLSFGMIANQTLYENNYLKTGDPVNGFPALKRGQNLGFEFAVSSDEITFQMRYMAQNQWLNWGGLDHYRMNSFQMGWLYPIHERRYFQTYLGCDYEYAQQTITSGLTNTFFGIPVVYPKTISNQVHAFGITSRTVFTWKGIYLSAQFGYRFDFSDDRWRFNQTPINDLNRSTFSGLHYSLGLGFVFGRFYKGFKLHP